RTSPLRSTRSRAACSGWRSSTRWACARASRPSTSRAGRGLMLERVSRIPMGVRVAIVALGTGLFAAATIAHHNHSDHGGKAKEAASPPSLGRHGGDWMPSRAKPASIVWAIGDGADGGADGRAVAAMVGSHRIDRLLYLGDVYESGTAREFRTNYAPLYGRFASITAPAIGNPEGPNLASRYV